MRAIVSSPRNGVYIVKFYFVVANANYADHAMPMIEIPCTSYKHACNVADAYNRNCDF